jgi:flagellar biosynthesis GTPase FlhF
LPGETSSIGESACFVFTGLPKEWSERSRARQIAKHESVFARVVMGNSTGPSAVSLRLPLLRKTTYGGAASRWSNFEAGQTEQRQMCSSWFCKRITMATGKTLIIFLTLVTLSWNAWSQVKRPLKAEDLEQLLIGGVTQERITQLVRESGVTFQMTPALKERFAKAGAGAEVMRAIESASAEYSKKALEAARRAEEDAKRKQQEAKQKEIDAAKRKAEEETKKLAEEAKRKAIEADNQRRIDEQRKREEEGRKLAAINKQKAAEDAKRRADEITKKKAAEDEARRIEEARKQQESQRRIDEARKLDSDQRQAKMKEQTKEPWQDAKNPIGLAPSCRVGANWTFRYDDGGRFVRRITGHNGDVCNVGKSFFDKEWLLLKQLGPNNEEITAPTLDQPLIGKQWMPFPISVGSEWRVEFRTKPTGSRNVSFYTDTFDVVGFEKVEVPAGSFMAFKIKVDRRTQGIWSIRYLWYAPQVEYYVKFRIAPEESHPAYETTFKNYQLVSYNLGGSKAK